MSVWWMGGQGQTDLQGNDDLLQVVQGQVDELGLTQDGAVYVGFADSFRPSQVNQIQLGPPHSLLSSLATAAAAK